MQILTSRVPRDDDTSVKLTISGKRENVDRVLALLAMIHLNGAWGHSGLFGISWDGDGADYVNITGKDFDPSKFKDLVQTVGDYGGVVEYVSEGGDGCVLQLPPGADKEYKQVYPPESA